MSDTAATGDMAEQRSKLVTWLRDAHAMESSTVDNLEKQVKQAEGYPQLAARFNEHLQQERRSVELVEQCLDRMGEDTSTLKEMGMKFTSKIQSFMTGAAPDEVVKNCIAAYAFESFEIASYRSLIAAAEQCGEAEIGSTCKTILREEEAMADWLKDHIPEITRQYLRTETR